MPAKGFKSITVREEVFKEIEQLAKDTNRSIPNTVAYLMEKAKNCPKEASS